MCRRLGLGHWNQVSFLAIADFASGSAANDLSRLTHNRHRNRGGRHCVRGGAIPNRLVRDLVSMIGNDANDPS